VSDDTKMSLCAGLAIGLVIVVAQYFVEVDPFDYR
jgi:hypothetical protein